MLSNPVSQVSCYMMSTITTTKALPPLPVNNDWPEPLRFTKISPSKSPPASPQFGATFIEERPARRRVSPSSQYMLNNIAPRPCEDDEILQVQRCRPRVANRAYASTQVPTRKALPRDRAVSHQVDIRQPARGLRQQDNDRRNMTDPTLRQHLQQTPLECSTANSRRSSNSSTSSLTGYRSPGTSATSPSSSISSTSSKSTTSIRLPPNSAEKWIPVVQAQLQSSMAPVLPSAMNPTPRLPPNSADRWKPVVHAQLLQQQQHPVPKPLPILTSSIVRKSSFSTPPTQITPAPVLANTTSVRKTSISAPIPTSNSTTDLRKLSTCSLPPLHSSAEFTCPRRSPMPQDQCISHWSDDDDDDDEDRMPIIQRLIVRGRRGSGTEGAERSRSRVRGASKGWGAWAGWN